MENSPGRLGEFVLRWASPLARLRRVPVLGRCVGWAGEKLLPRDSLTWVQVQRGPAKGLWLHLHPRTGTAYFEGRGELEVQEALQEHLRPGMTFYDIGANIGFYSLLAARTVGEQGCIVAFEADPEISARLREHVERNSMSRIKVEEIAVWSQSCPVSFARADPSSSPERGLGHVVHAGDGPALQVRAVSLDDYTLSRPAPDFMKWDVEGAEVEVFRGARRLLQENHPGIICEMHSEENKRILQRELARAGYLSKPCGANHILAIPR